MKKKAIKIAASTAVAASAFVAAAPAQQADAATNVNQLLTDAQNAGTVLKWAISVEGSADYKTQPFTQYNAAKKAIASAEAASAKLGASQKLSADAKLVEPKLQVKRAQAYIDAITSSDKIKDLTSALDAAIKSNDIEKVETAYHTATAEYRKQAALLDRVYGQSTRDGIRNAVKPAIEKLVADVKNDVTVNMLAKAAAADVKANKTADASKKIAEAQAILDANVLKWETSLQKSVDDVTASLPLAISNVSYVDNKTLVVTLTKPVVAVSESEVVLDNGAVVTKTALSADKKTLTLTTTQLSAATKYSVTYKNSTVSFDTPASPVGNVDVNQSALHAEVGQSLAVSASFKTSQGTVHDGPVRITLTDDTDYEIATVNGAAATATDIYYPVNGQLVVTVKASGTVAATGEKVKFEALTGVGGSAFETKTSGALNFYTVPTTLTLANNATGTVKYVDAANNYFVNNNNEKISLSANGNVYQDTNNAVITLDALKAKLSKGDVVTGSYVKSGGSTLKLELDKVNGVDFSVDQEYLGSTTAFRVEGNTITLTGTGEAGKVVSIYNTSLTRPVAQTTVRANGTWSVALAVDPTIPVTFQSRQAANVNEVAPDYVSNLAGLSDELTVVAGKFDATASTGTGASETITGKTIIFTAGKTVDQSNVKITSNATITLLDGDLTKATYTNGVNNTSIVKTATGFDITFGAPTSISGGDGKINGSATVNAVTGITNEYGLKVNVTNSIIGY